MMRPVSHYDRIATTTTLRIWKRTMVPTSSYQQAAHCHMPTPILHSSIKSPPEQQIT